MSQKGIDERLRFRPRGGMDDHTDRLIDYQEVLVLVDYIQFYLFGLYLGLYGRRYDDIYRFTCKYLVVSFGERAINEDMAIGY